MLKLINFLLSKIPFNGKKTSGGFIALGISMLLSLFAQHLPVQPSDQNLEIIVSNLVEAVKLVTSSLDLLGLTAIGAGLFHKAVKRLLGNFN